MMKFLKLLSFMIFSLHAYAYSDLEVVNYIGDSYHSPINSNQINLVDYESKVDSGSIIKTGAKSTLMLALNGNGYLYLGPTTTLQVQNRSKGGAQYFNVMEGDVFFIKKPEWGDRPAGAILFPKDYPFAYTGDAFKMSIFKSKLQIKAYKGKVTRLELPKFSKLKEEDFFIQQIENEAELEGDINNNYLDSNIQEILELF